jgi:hypothetical protein
MLPAVLTLADTKGIAAADTAVIKFATLPVPPIVTIAAVFVDVPGCVAFMINEFDTVKAFPVGVVVPVITVSPVVIRSRIVNAAVSIVVLYAKALYKT